MKQTILLVDDHPENLIALEAILEAPDRILLTANSGNEALQIMIKNDISLVLLDVQMPDMDGFEVAKLMRQNQRTKHLPIVFCTAISKDQQYVFHGYDIGAIDYLFKPIDPTILIAKVGVFLEMDRQKRILQRNLLQLKRLQQENQKLLSAIGEGVVSVNSQGAVTFVNPAAAAFLDVPQEDITGAGIAELLLLGESGEPISSWEDSSIYKTVSRAETFQGGGFFAKRSDGLSPIDVTISAINNADEPFSGAVIVFRAARSGASGGHDHERRMFAREHLDVDIRVFDRYSGENVGQLLNISNEGVKLETKKSISKSAVFELSMVLPESINSSTTLSVDAECLWCHSVSFSTDFHAGFKLKSVNQESLEIISYLSERY